MLSARAKAQADLWLPHVDVQQPLLCVFLPVEVQVAPPVTDIGAEGLELPEKRALRPENLPVRSGRRERRPHRPPKGLFAEQDRPSTRIRRGQVLRQQLRDGGQPEGPPNTGVSGLRYLETPCGIAPVRRVPDGAGGRHVVQDDAGTSRIRLRIVHRAALVRGRSGFSRAGIVFVRHAVAVEIGKRHLRKQRDVHHESDPLRSGFVGSVDRRLSDRPPVPPTHLPELCIPVLTTAPHRNLGDKPRILGVVAAPKTELSLALAANASLGQLSLGISILCVHDDDLEDQVRPVRIPEFDLRPNPLPSHANRSQSQNRHQGGEKASAHRTAPSSATRAEKPKKKIRNAQKTRQQST